MRRAPALDRAALVRSHTWIVAQFVARYSHRSRGVDLESAGLLGLCEAADRYKPESGVKFATYAWNWVKGGILEELRLAHLVPMSKRAALGKTATPVIPPVMLGIPANDHNHSTTLGRDIDHSRFCWRNGLVSNDTTEHDLDQRQQRDQARSLVRRLPSVEHRRVGGRALAGQSAAEIAEALGMTEPKVARILRQIESELSPRRRT